MTHSKQVAIPFTSPVAPLIRQRKVRPGAEQRYNDCLDYLRAELASNTFERISPDEIARVFKVTSAFLHIVVATGAITARRIKGKLHYKAEPKLSTLTGLDVLSFRLSEFPNPPYEPEPVVPDALKGKTPEQIKAIINTLNSPIEPMALTMPGPELLQHQLHGEKPTYLVGSFNPKEDTVMRLQTCKAAHFHDLPSARACADAYPVREGAKIVICQVIEVLELSVTRKPSTL